MLGSGTRLPLLLLVLAVAGPAATQRPDWFLARESPGDVRVMTFNIGANSVFPRTASETQGRIDRAAAGSRILRAIAPDVACLNEVRPPRTATDAGELFDSVLPLDGQARWQVFGSGDTAIVSRYPLRQPAGVVADFGVGPRAHSMALVDLPGASEPDLYLICAHLQSHGGDDNIAARERQADSITRWIRDARSPGGDVDLPPGTAIVVAGDLNVYENDPRRHLEGLVEGRVLHAPVPDTPQGPDWNGHPLADALPLHNARGPENYTFRAGGTDLMPGPLDRVLYTASVVDPRRRFVLNSRALTAEELARAGLMKDDSVLNPSIDDYDHLPVVVDFRRQP